MSFLTAAQSAAIKLIGQKPTAFFSETDQFSLEICDLANDVAQDLVRAHDWRALTKLQTYTGDGTTQGFALPSDYDRMVSGGEVFRPDWVSWHYVRASDLNQWYMLLIGAPAVTPGFWIILDGDMQFWPVIPTGDSADWYYISKNIVRDSGGTAKAAFTSDSDTMVLDEDLLKLGLIWKWRAQKKLDYGEEMAEYEKVLAEISGRDKGARVLAEGRLRAPGNMSIAYPRALGV